MPNIIGTTHVAAACARKRWRNDETIRCKVLRCGIALRRPVVQFLLTIALYLSVGVLFAQEGNTVQTTLIAEVRETQEVAGKAVHRYFPAAVVAQGQVVYYTVQMRNPATVPLRNVTVVQRIPANTRYVAASAAGPSADITFSVDGGQTFWPERQLPAIAQANVSRPATPREYTHIRWQLRNALAPGAVALARFQAVFQ